MEKTSQTFTTKKNKLVTLTNKEKNRWRQP